MSKTLLIAISVGPYILVNPIRKEKMTEDASPSPPTFKYLAPFLVLAIVGLFSPTPLEPEFDEPQFRLPFGQQILVYVAAQAALMTTAIAVGWRVAMKPFPVRLSLLAVSVGIVGAILWIAICQLQVESAGIQALGLGAWFPTRAGLNPFLYFDSSTTLGLFLLLRFSILVILVPVAEEWLIRGWLVRWWTSPDGWYESSLSRVSLASLMMVVVYAVLTHPHEALAAIVWFSLVSWLMVKTGNLFDCIVAHGVTNLLLGIFVIFSEQWRLW